MLNPFVKKKSFLIPLPSRKGKTTSRVGQIEKRHMWDIFQLFPNVPEQQIEQYKNFLLIYLSHAMLYS